MQDAAVAAEHILSAAVGAAVGAVVGAAVGQVSRLQ